MLNLLAFSRYPFVMSEKDSSRAVHVDVIPDFDCNKKHGYYVSVELSEAERQLKGIEFVEAVRKALYKRLGTGQVMVHRNGPIRSKPTTEESGRFVDPEEITFTGFWRYKEMETERYRLT